MIAQN